jgi:hypothetical protein
MQHKTLTVLIYLSAAAATSWFWLGTNPRGGMEPTSILAWLFFFAIPLLFVFAYPRFLFADSPTQRSSLRISALLRGLGVAMTTFLFTALVLPFGKTRYAMWIPPRLH